MVSAHRTYAPAFLSAAITFALIAPGCAPLGARRAQRSPDAYRAGRLSFPSVLEAERNLLTARSGYLAALKGAALATVDLERVTGRPAATWAALPSAPISATRPSSRPTEVQVRP